MPRPATNTTWIFLRGLTRESAHWGRFMDEFAAAHPGAHINIIALDLPGNGMARTLPSPASVSTMVDYCQAELARRNARPPYQLLAMSLGAMVATAWCYRTPSDITACVLINTSMRPFSPFYQRLRPGNYAALLKLTLLGATPAQWEEAILRLTSNNPSQHHSVLAAWVAARQERPVSRANALRQLLAAARFSAPSTPPPVPLLLLASAQDHLVNVECSRAIASAWGSALVEHPTAGHDLPLDDPLWVAVQAQGWLAA